MERDLSTVQIREGSTVTDVLMTVGFATSKNEARRLIAQGGVFANHERVDDPDVSLPFQNGWCHLRVGRRRVASIERRATVDSGNSEASS